MNLCSASYTPNLLNQYTSRTVPGAVDIMGVSFATNTVTVNGQAAYRKGEYFRKELPIANTAGPVWTNITVSATGQGSTNGSVLVPKAAETFWPDLDGNLLSDSLWTNRWNAENRLVQVESTTGLAANKRMREVWTHLPDGRWIERIVSTNNGSAYYPAFTNRFVWDGQVLMAVLDHTNGLVMSFMRGLDLSGSIQGAGGVGGVLAVSFAASTLNPQPSTHFVSYDGNGNVVALVDASTGSSSGQFEYGPFSEAIRVTGIAAQMMPLRFSTMYEDSVTGDRKYLFRDLDPSAGRWKSRDPIQENGGMNLSGFLQNDSVNCMDELGLKWTITRFGGRRALAYAQCGDTVQDLAEQIGLDDKDYTEWLKGSYIPLNVTEPLVDGESFTIPNMVYIEFGSWGGWSLDFASPIPRWQADLRQVGSLLEDSGFRVELTEDQTAVGAAEHLRSDDIYMFLYAGHGAMDANWKSVGTLAFSLQKNGASLEAEPRRTKYGIHSMLLLGCNTGSKDGVPEKYRARVGWVHSPWEKSIATRGQCTSVWGSVNGYQAYSHILHSPGTNR